MYTFEFDGHQTQVTERVFYEDLRRAAEWLELNAERQHRSQRQGFPDLRGKWKPTLINMDRDSTNLGPQIQDRELRELFHLLIEQTRSFLTEVDDQFVASMAKRAGIPFPRTQRARNKLASELEGMLFSGIELIDDAYREVLPKAEQALNEIRATRKRIDEKLAEHFARLDAG